MKKIHYPIRILKVLHTSKITGPNKSSFVRLKYFDKTRFQIDVASPAEGEFVQKIKDIGLRHLPLEFEPGKQLSTLCGLIKILKENKYHILHGHMIWFAPLICIAGKLCAMPVTMVSEHMNSRYHEWLAGRPVRLFFHKMGHVFTNNCLDKVIAVSEDARENYIFRQGMRPDKVVYIPNSIDFSAVVRLDTAQKKALKTELGFPEDALLIGMVGRLIKEKGYSDGIIAAGDIIQQHPKIRFIVAGDGPEKQNLQNLAAQNGLADKIKFLGFVRNIDALMPAFDILIQPSRKECYESFGNTLIEAMSSKVLAVASNVNAFKEIIQDGSSGILFAEKNPADLAAKVISIINQPERMRTITDRGYQICQEKFNAQITVKLIEKVYEQTLLEKGYTLC